jgi:2',3'-cyclic-nucleotide 2'-phosphodiesterase (5'-nucleotidase family)
VKTLPAVVLLVACTVLVFPQEDGETSLTILYSSSLNGNINGCDCKGHPRAGLVKRAAWLRKLKDPEQTLLVDAGDLLEYRERYPLMAHNLSVCLDENSCIFFSTTPLIVERGGARIGVFALIDPQVFTLYPSELKDKLKIQDPAAAACNQLYYLEKQGVEATVLLYHGPYESATALAEKVKGVDVLILGHEQRLIEARRIGNTIVASPGEDGNRLGILDLSLGSTGRIEFSNRFRWFSWREDPDDPQIRQRIDEYKQKLRDRLDSPKGLE